jgi:hypothetical protein
MEVTMFTYLVVFGVFQAVCGKYLQVLYSSHSS